MVNRQSDDEGVRLARELVAGDAGAFERFVEFFRTRIFQYSWLMCGQRDDAEEVAQDTLLKVFENFDQLREPGHVRAWVFRIARNECLMKRRRSIFAPAEEVPVEVAMTTGWEPADDSELPDALAERGEVRRAIENAIRALPPLYRAVVLLRDVEELTTEQTAEILDVSTDVVKQRLHRARVAMREQLAPLTNIAEVMR